MNVALLGKKVGMTQIYDDKGEMVPITVIQAGPCMVMQVKTQQSDGYNALQLGFDDVKRSRCKKPQIGHAKKAGVSVKRFIREVRLEDQPVQKPGEELNVELFKEIKYVDVTGTSKGKGFAGVMKRHHFKGMCGSHGTERKHRHPGGIGANSGGRGTSRAIRRGKKMGGHMGHVRCTTRNHRIMGIDKENDLLLVKGSIGGPRNGYVVIAQAKTKS